MEIARHFLNANYTDDQARRTLFLNHNRYYAYNGDCYKILSKDELNCQLYNHMDKLWYNGGTKKQQEAGYAVRGKVRVTSKTVSEVRYAMIAHGILIPSYENAPT